MVGDEVGQLAEFINACIGVRGIYTLMDERLDLVCGPDTIKKIDSPDVMRCMQEFADAHGWSVTRFETGFVLWPRDSGMQPAEAQLF